MIQAFSMGVLLFFFILANSSFAQESPVSVKVYSGCLHQVSDKNKALFFNAFWGGKSKKEEMIQDRQCSIEFKSKTRFSQQSDVAVEPEALSYYIKFTNSPSFLGKFLIRILTKDDQEYYIDPESEGKQIAINEEHHITDTYLIYLLLGSNIDHIEIVSPAQDNLSRYLLDKVEVYNAH